MTIREARLHFYSKLTSSDVFYTSPSPYLDLDCFLQTILNVNRSYLIAHGDENIIEEHYQTLEDMVKHRIKGIPVAYITGKKEFWSLNFFITSDVLIPKSDTEILVEQALSICRIFAQEQKHLHIADVCCGSGCIFISILHTLLQEQIFEHIECTASDISMEAIEVSRKNATNLLDIKNHPTMTLSIIQSDLFSNDSYLNKKFDIIVSNPPYVPTTLTDELLLDGRNEPRLALDGGQKGLDIIKNLVTELPHFLNVTGQVLIETGEYNAKETGVMLKKTGFTKIEHIVDLEGQNRVVKATKL